MHTHSTFLKVYFLENYGFRCWSMECLRTFLAGRLESCQSQLRVDLEVHLQTPVTLSSPARIDPLLFSGVCSLRACWAARLRLQVCSHRSLPKRAPLTGFRAPRSSVSSLPPRFVLLPATSGPFLFLASAKNKV